MTAKRWAAVGVGLFLFLAGVGYFAAGVLSTSDAGPVRGLLIVCGVGLIVGAVQIVRRGQGQTGEEKGQVG